MPSASRRGKRKKKGEEGRGKSFKKGGRRPGKPEQSCRLSNNLGPPVAGRGEGGGERQRRRKGLREKKGGGELHPSRERKWRRIQPAIKKEKKRERRRRGEEEKGQEVGRKRRGRKE